MLSQPERISELLGGSDRSVRAKALRLALGCVEPIYASAMRVRNLAYDRHLLNSRRLPFPTISVGNLTTGGTGKTPVVRWLAGQFIGRKLQPAILFRGYGAAGSEAADEARMLEGYFDINATIVANPNRVFGAYFALRRDPEPDLFILDDGFQHRRVARDFDLVLISATQPFGFDHVLPRGLLREPLAGLRRAHAVVITRAGLVDPQELKRIEETISRVAPGVAIYQADHHLAGLRTGGGLPLAAPEAPLSELSRRRPFLVCGIANPQSLKAQLETRHSTLAGYRWFADHHAYTRGDVTAVFDAARAAGADVLLTTEKDWVKLSPLLDGRQALPVWRIELDVVFREDGEARLMEQLRNGLRQAGLKLR